MELHIHYSRNFNESRDKIEPAFCEIEFEFDTRKEAQDVFDSLEDTMQDYKVLNMADVLAAAGMEAKTHSYGWKWEDISKMRIERKGDKYALVIPKGLPID